MRLKSVLTAPLLGVALIGAVVGVATPASSPSAPARFSYDQVQVTFLVDLHRRIVDSPPGSFERDYRWASSHTGDTDHDHAIVHHVAYFDGWTRVETDQSIQLASRRENIVIIADKSTRTYRRYTGEKAKELLAPGRRSQYGTAASTLLRAGRGSAVYDVRDSYAPLAGRTFDGIRATGRRIEETTVARSVTGSCALGAFSLKEYRARALTDEYRAAFEEPSNVPFHVRKFDDRVEDDCSVRVVRPVMPSEQRRYSGLFLLYKREEDAVEDGGKMKIWSIDVVERGHVRTLTDADANLFQIPRGYTDACTALPAPEDCEPRPAYASLAAKVVIHRPLAGFDRIFQAHDGTLWVSESWGDRLAHISNDRSVREISLPKGAHPGELTEAADGAIWFTEEGFGSRGRSGIARYSRGGTMTESIRLRPAQDVGGIAALAHSVWFTRGSDNDEIDQLLATGKLRRLPLGSQSWPGELKVGRNKSLWTTEYRNDSVVRVTQHGRLTRFTLKSGGNPFGIDAGRSLVWFTAGYTVGYINTADGRSRVFVVPRSDSSADEIVALPNSAAAFSEERGRIGVVSATGTFKEFVVPGQPDGLFLDSRGDLWYTDKDYLRFIPQFLTAIHAN